MTRTFVVVGHDAPTRPDFSLSDLPGAGRLDVLCRCLVSALLHSHDIREDTRVYLVLDDTFLLRIDGDTVRRLNPDERSTAALIRTALEQREEAVGRMEVETTPGVFLSRGDLETALEAVEGPLFKLHEDGEPVVTTDSPDNPSFVLSDHCDFRDAEESLLDAAGARSISLGPLALHGNQAITVTHNWLDTDGFTRY